MGDSRIGQWKVDMSKSQTLQIARSMALAVTNSTASLTSPLRQLPDFLIVGAQRCGTTSMFKTLAQHPGVTRPFLRKGIHYFDKNYHRGLAWYRGQFPLTVGATLRGRSTLTGESSPYYSFHPLAAERIARDLPDVKVVMLLRDPVERAYSGHSHELARGYETEPFARALELEDERTAGERERMVTDPSYDSFSFQHHSYLARGRYIEQIQRFETLLGRDRIHLVDSVEFFTQPAESFAAVLDFLGLEQTTAIRFEQHNARHRSPMDEQLRQDLADKFAEPDDALRQWWGKTPSWRQ